MTTPAWQPAKNGFSNDLNATDASAQVNQFLGTHNITPIYKGLALVTPKGGEQLFALTGSSRPTFDLSQPFTLPGGHTSIGRITFPLSFSGNGADVLVSLYPDNGSGSPDTTTLLSSTLIPASWITSLGAPEGLAAGGPLATARSNTLYATGGADSGVPANPWTAPAGGPSGGGSQYASITTSGNYLIMAGGYLAGTPAASVNTVQYTGGLTIGNPVSQPALPNGTYYGALAATTSSLVYAGGTTATATSTAAVWVASWSSASGQVGTWSSQPNLPTALQEAGSATFGDTVYVVGGQDPTASILYTTVYQTTVNNGQITAWTTGPPIPKAVKEPAVAVIGNWLIVAGGNTATGSGNVPSGSVYYSRINADGSLNNWQTGPNLPTPVNMFSPGWDYAFTDSALIIIGGFIGVSTETNAIQTIMVSDTGLADSWTSLTWQSATVLMIGAFAGANGEWNIFNTDIPSSLYRVITMNPLELVSVPLPASGLTGGNTYHVVLQQQQTSSTADLVVFYQVDASPLPSDMLRSNRYQNTWSVLNSSNAIPMAVYDNTPGGNILHTWEDPSSTGNTRTSNLAARTSTMIYDYRNRFIGLCESSPMPNNPLNSNPTFTTTTAPWTNTGCTLTRSSTHVQGGFPFSGLMTPDGVTSGPYIQSELVPVNTGSLANNENMWCLAQGWVFSPTGYNQVSLSINWFDRSNGYLSTTFSGFNVAANTWTFLYTYGKIPTGASFAGINPTQTGVPAVSNLLYMSDLTISFSPEGPDSLAPVSQVVYSSIDPARVIGVSQLN